MTDTDISITQNAENSNQLGTIIIHLFKGVIYQEHSPALWNQLFELKTRVQDYVTVIGLDLHMDEAEGYAFLRSRPESDTEDFPRLIPRRALSFPVSLLIALLRKKLAEHDAGGGDLRLILSQGEIIELVRVFMPENNNEVKFMDQIGSYINKAVELGFLRNLRGQDRMYEVCRIIKTYVDAQWLAEFDKQLLAYQNQLSGEIRGDGDE